MGYRINDIVEVTITGIEPYGAFVSFKNGSKGLLHISEISYDYVADIHDYVKKNEKIKVKIIDILDDGKIRVSLKALQKQRVRRRRVSHHKDLNFTIGFSRLEKQLKVWLKDLEEEYNDKV